MKRILALTLGISVCGHVLADTTARSNTETKSTQFDKEQIAAYIEKLVTTGCELAINNDSVDDVVDNAIDDATHGMDKKSDTYVEIHNSIVFGSRMGTRFKKNGWESFKGGDRISSCEELGSWLPRQEGVDEMITSLADESSQLAIAFKNVAVYQTTARSLTALYSENEVAADDKIAGRKVEITGVIQEIRKDFTDDVVIELQTGNPFMPVSLSMEDSERRKAAKLRKGQKAVITCDKMMLMIGAPYGSNCRIN